MINNVTLMGHLGGDAELVYLPSGTEVATWTLAVTKRWRDDHGEDKEKTTWLRCKIFGKWAEGCAAFRKGNCVIVEGELSQEEWNDKKTGEKRSRTVVLCRTARHVTINRIDRYKGTSTGAGTGKPAPSSDPPAPGAPAPLAASSDQPANEDDIPF